MFSTNKFDNIYLDYKVKVSTNEITNDLIDIQIKYHTYCTDKRGNESTPYVINNQFKYKEYKVVGFYKQNIYEDKYGIVLKDDYMLNAITYSENDNKAMFE